MAGERDELLRRLHDVHGFVVVEVPDGRRQWNLFVLSSEGVRCCWREGRDDPYCERGFLSTRAYAVLEALSEENSEEPETEEDGERSPNAVRDEEALEELAKALDPLSKEMFEAGCEPGTTYWRLCEGLREGLGDDDWHEDLAELDASVVVSVVGDACDCLWEDMTDDELQDFALVLEEARRKDPEKGMRLGPLW